MFSLLPLGCYGSDLENKKCISMQITPSTVIDTGALLSSFNISQLLEIRNLIITHSHFDHIKDLPTFSDFMLSFGNHSFNLYTTKTIMKELKQHILNDLIWPDFTKLPNSKTPTINFKPIEFDKPFVIDNTEFTPIEMNHLVESIGFIIKKEGKVFAYSGDTGICDNFIDHIKQEPKIKTLCWETSFPNRLKKLAELSKHLSPSMLEGELAKLNKKYEVHIFHLKPNLEEEIISDIGKIRTDMHLTTMKQKKPIFIS